MSPAKMKNTPRQHPPAWDGWCKICLDRTIEIDGCERCGALGKWVRPRALWGREWGAVAWMAACRRLTVALIHDDGVQNGMDVDAEALFSRYLSFEFDSIEENELAVREMLGLWNEERDGLF